MKRTFAVIILYAVTLMPVAAQSGKKITIIHTNDLHSRLAGYAPELAYTPLSVNDDATVGGFSRIASIINGEKKKAAGVSLVVDAGDFLMGTLFQALEPSTGFQLRLMKRMGYDAVCIGNHEFDFGPGTLAEIISSSKNAGEIPPLLLGNAVFSEEDTADDQLMELFDNGTISRSFILERDGIKVGFFSLLGKVADENAAFAPPVTFSKQVKTARKLAAGLRKQGCDIVICLSHSGVSKGKKGEWEGEDVSLALKVKDIDVVISGHTHTRLDKPLMIKGTTVVQTGEYGKNVGVLTLGLNEGTVSVDGYSLIPVDDRVEGDEPVNDLIMEQKELVTEKILAPAGMDYDRPLAEASYVLECDEQGDVADSNLGPLVADAIHSYVNNHVAGGTDISMVAVGVIRDRIMPGLQSAPDIFRIMSMGKGDDDIPGYPLSKVYVTGRELKSILEILMMAGRSTPSNYCYYSGMNAEYDPGKGLLRKIQKITILKSDGTQKVVDFSKKNKTLYAITANSYMLEFVGIIKKMSKGLINVVPKDAGGSPVTDMKKMVMDFDSSKDGIQEGKEWLAIVELLSGMNDINNNAIPDIDERYRMPVRSLVDISAGDPD
ncbi:MAG TPA: bifunctional UDP-sugar hydrolase/5'-nucleotidase [Bacteroidales bacterium]|nr:bifunctional UDP-sugar hydrolase/5'-nucleotidase [Bacteroidales bacterium]HPF03334.1 bifunctional UDP-sugar hydrolase/5'-nucleotidase [Bacteroidales bacterium]HPJ59179.1 bifunctional UDP-sugar hydrolase/5'-nucleotidase [Bacteroidales bacterium]HPR12791.1 bifunctional UDP-sugar hydrolase/5'-nucleotidase [Bacteroidales bacterium]HRW84395.1 bifunctional UDP-sugar hydrolase/5'-nucleotidase [Bacteroidales bacterium]